MQTDLGFCLSARRRALQLYLHDPSSNRVRRKAGTPEVGAESVNERGIVKENEHGPQSQVVTSAALAETVIPQCVEVVSLSASSACARDLLSREISSAAGVDVPVCDAEGRGRDAAERSVPLPLPPDVLEAERRAALPAGKPPSDRFVATVLLVVALELVWLTMLVSWIVRSV